MISLGTYVDRSCSSSSPSTWYRPFSLLSEDAASWSREEAWMSLRSAVRTAATGETRPAAARSDAHSVDSARRSTCGAEARAPVTRGWSAVRARRRADRNIADRNSNDGRACTLALEGVRQCQQKGTTEYSVHYEYLESFANTLGALQQHLRVRVHRERTCDISRYAARPRTGGHRAREPALQLTRRLGRDAQITAVVTFPSSLHRVRREVVEQVVDGSVHQV